MRKKEAMVQTDAFYAAVAFESRLWIGKSEVKLEYLQTMQESKGVLGVVHLTEIRRRLRYNGSIPAATACISPLRVRETMEGIWASSSKARICRGLRYGACGPDKAEIMVQRKHFSSHSHHKPAPSMKNRRRKKSIFKQYKNPKESPVRFM
jgi:hypothetical protein